MMTEAQFASLTTTTKNYMVALFRFEQVRDEFQHNWSPSELEAANGVIDGLHRIIAQRIAENR